MHLGINTDGKKIYMPHALPGANNGGNVAYNEALKRNHEERNEAILELRDAGWSNGAIHEILLECGWHIEQAASINTIARLDQIKKQKDAERKTKEKQKEKEVDQKKKEQQSEERDYKKEYADYHSKPEQIKRRAKRNEARRSLKDRKDIKGKDVHHKDNNPMNNDKSNLSIVSQKYNRSEPRLRKLKEKGILPNVRK